MPYSRGVVSSPSQPVLVQDESIDQIRRQTLNFVGAGVTVTDTGGKTTITIPGGATNFDSPGFRSITAPAYGANNNFSSQNTAISACQDALVADGGGMMLIPPGNFYCNAPLTMKSGVHWFGFDRSSQLVFGYTGGATTGFSLIYNSFGNRIRMSQVSLYGPATDLSTLGAIDTTLSGIQLGRGAILRDMHIERFQYGIAQHADHTHIHNIDIENCLAGIVYPDGANAWGDHTYHEVTVTGNMLAGVYTPAGNSHIDHSKFDNFHVVSTPWGFLRQGAATAGWLNASEFHHLSFENVGNGAFGDLSTGGQNSMLNCIINGSGYTQNNAYKMGSLHSGDAIYLPNEVSGGYIRSDFYPFYGIVLGTAEGTIIYEGGNGAAGGGGSGFPSGIASANAIFISQYGNRFVSYIATGTITAGDLVEMVSTTSVQRVSAIVPTTGIFGVAGNSVTNGQTVWIGVDAPGYSVLSETISAANVPLVQITGTKYRVGKQSDYPANPVIGHSMAAGGGVGGAGGTTTAVTAYMDIPQ